MLNKKLFNYYYSNGIKHILLHNKEIVVLESIADRLTNQHMLIDQRNIYKKRMSRLTQLAAE